MLSIYDTFVSAEKDNCDVADFVTQRPSNLLKQPFLVVVGSLEKPQSFVLIIDNISVPCVEAVRHCVYTQQF